MKHTKIILIIIFIFTLSGCGFSGGEKTIDIKNIENDKSVVSDENVQDVENDKSAENVESVEDTRDVVDDKNVQDVVNDESVENVEEVKDIEIIKKLVDWGFSVSSGRKIDTVIIHSSYNAVGSDEHNLDDIIYKQYKFYGVSPHYIISREGKIYQLVADKNIAYHAGVSSVPDGRKNVNDFSIGIEIVNTKSEKPNSEQYGALENLISQLKEKYKIKYILGHSEIAPERKDDPWNFDYGKIR